ncbi:MAG: PD40 domain-containing protein [Chloroflexi bacterium]|nr:PD40 domain-containing protein [Chloroflexota bacterium]
MSRSPSPALCLLCLFLLATLLAACQLPPATPSPEPVVQVADTPTAVPPTDTPTAEPPAPTPTPVPPTDTPTPIPPTDTPTSIPPTDTPTAVPPTDTPEPTATPEPAAPQAVIGDSGLNVRGGPGTNYPVIATAPPGGSFAIVVKNGDASWWQICCVGPDDKEGWVFASLVTVEGATSGIEVAKEIPEPPAAPAPPPAGAPRGVLVYSVANMDAEKWELWEHNFDSGQSKFLFDWRTEVEFSPDYRQFAYFAWPGDVSNDQVGIWAMNADYSDAHLIIRGGAYPSWSPDGGRLVANSGADMYVFNADGSGLRRVGPGEYPAWSRTSNWIAHRACVGGGCGIYLTDPDSGAQQRLTTGGSDGQPAWSPDGQQIAYISQDDGNFEIYRVNADGTKKVRLTDSPTSDGLPIWSPDGQWIAFRSDRDGTWAIYVMRSDGSDVRKVVDAPVLPLWFFEKMGWRP